MEPVVDVRVSAFLDPSSDACSDPCGLCLSAPTRYSCPRCNVSYCSLSCYRGSRHQTCSEAFYRDEVLRGLQEAGNSEGRKGNIDGILRRMRDAALQEEEGFDSERENLEDEEPEEASLEEGLDGGKQGDLEGLDPETLWQWLTPAEQKDFQRLLESGGLGTLLRPWQPWWERHMAPLLVQDVEAGSEHHEVSETPLKKGHIAGQAQQKGTETLPKEKDADNTEAFPELKTTELPEATNGPKMEPSVGAAAPPNPRSTQGRETHKQPQATINMTCTGGFEGHPSPGRTETMTPTRQGHTGGIEVHRCSGQAATQVTAINTHEGVQKQQNTPLEQKVGAPAEASERARTVAYQRPNKGIEERKQQKLSPKRVIGDMLQGNGAPSKNTYIDDQLIMGGTAVDGDQKSATVMFPKYQETDGKEMQEDHCSYGDLASPTQRNIGSSEDPKQSGAIMFQNLAQYLPVDEKMADFQKRAHLDEISESHPNANHSTVPAVPNVIPPLSSLTHNTSPLVRFNLVNVLYAYAFGLKLYNGDLDDHGLLQEFCDAVLEVSGVLNSTRVFGSVAEALQASIQAVLAGGSHGDPYGAALAVAHILIGGSSNGRKYYTLAALSHLAGFLAKARKLAPKDERHILFNAKKKCEFLLSWANENEDTLTLLSLEVYSEYKNYMASLKEVEHDARKLEKSWGGSKPPEKTVLVQELD